ncbi:MAG: phage integrase SAM-like domain-containing protein [Sphaerochaeta sp.]
MDNFTLTKTKGYWYYYCYYQEKRKRFSTGVKNQKRAYQYCLDLERSRRLIPNKETGQITFGEFAKPFYVWGECPIVSDKISRGYHYSQTLCNSNKLCLNKNIIPTFGDLCLSEITEDMVNIWLLDLKNPRMVDEKKYKGIANSTANKQLKLLRDIFSIAVKRRLIETDPAKNVHKLYDNVNRRGSFTLEEAQQILSHKEYWESHFVLLIK